MAMEEKTKEDCQLVSGSPMTDQVICSVPNINATTLSYSIVNYRVIRGYSGYKDLVGAVDATTVG